MRTLLVTNDFPPKVGGIQSYLFGLVSSLDPSGVTVLAPTFPASGEFDAEQPFRVVRWPSLLYPSLRLLRKVCDLASGVDVVQFGYALQSWAIAPAMRRRTGRPYAVFAHGAEVLLPLRLPGASRLLLRGSLAGASGILAVSAHTASGLERRTGGRVRCTVVRPIVDLERFRPRPRDREAVRARHGLGRGTVVLCVSRLAPRKGQDLLVEILPELRQRFGARLVLVGGGGRERSLRRLAQRHGVHKQVVFAGRVPARLLPSYYAAADVFAMPVRSRLLGAEEEGFGVVFAEAAAAGLPVVAGRSGGSGEAVEDGETGYLVDGSSRTETRRALSLLLGDEGLRKKMGAAGRARVASLHGAGAVGDRYREALWAAVGWGASA